MAKKKVAPGVNVAQADATVPRAPHMLSSPVSYGPMCLFLGLTLMDYSMHTGFHGNSSALSAYFYRRHIDAPIYFRVTEIILFLLGIYGNFETLYNCVRKEMSPTRLLADLGSFCAWAVNLVISIVKVVPAQMELGSMFTGTAPVMGVHALQDITIFYLRIVLATFLLQLIFHFIVWRDGQVEKEKESKGQKDD